MRTAAVFLGLVLGITGAAAQAAQSPAIGSDELIARARASARPEHVREAERPGTEIRATQDARSFVLVWRPATPIRAWVVTLHGSASWAHDEIALWRPSAERASFGIVALQWWFGGGARPEDYYAPHEVRRELDHLLAAVGAVPQHTLLHGFSRASANLYALAALDAQQPRRLFRHVIANAGGASMDYPQNRAIDSGRFGPRPFAATQWWMWCGARDPNPERDGCSAMRRARAWVSRLGGQTELIEDETAGHGGFHRNGRNLAAAIAWFERRE